MMQKASMPVIAIPSTTQLAQIVAFDEHAQAPSTFAQRYLDLVAATSRLSHHKGHFERMLDLLEEQMLIHVNYRYWAQQAISTDTPGLALKGDVDTSRTAILQDILLLFSALSEQGHTPDEATRFLMLRTAALFCKKKGIPIYNRRQRAVPIAQSQVSGQCFIREEPSQEPGQTSEEARYACFFDAASEASLEYPTSPWPRCLLAMLELVDGAARTEAALGFLDALVLLRELKSRDQRVRLLTTIMRYCDL